MKNSVYHHQLANHLRLEIEDQTNRYFGDYHRVRLVVRCPVPVLVDYFADNEDPEKAVKSAVLKLGHEVVFEKILERMGISSSEVDPTRQQLIDQFIKVSDSYLARDDFPSRFLAQKLRTANSTARSGGDCY